jgi:hypothetical protein
MVPMPPRLPALVADAPPASDAVAEFGSVFVAASLVYVLAYLSVVDATPGERRSLRATLVVLAVPLGLTFLCVLAVRSYEVLG